MFPIKHLSKSLLLFTLIINSFVLLSSPGFAGFPRTSGSRAAYKAVPQTPPQEFVQTPSQETSGNKKAKKSKKNEETFKEFLSGAMRYLPNDGFKFGF